MSKLRKVIEQGMGCAVVLSVVGVATISGGTMAARSNSPSQKPERMAGTPASPLGVVAVPSPALLVLDKSENALAIVDATTLQVVGKVATGPVPHEVAASTDGKLAFVTNYGAHQDGTTLSVIDLVAQKELHRVDLTPLRGPHGIIFFDGEAWFTVEGSKKIARYDPKANKVDWVHDIGQERTHMLVVAPNERTIYTTNVNSDTVMAAEKDAPGAGWSNTLIAVGKGPEGEDISPNGKELWVANSHDGTVSIIDTATKKVVQTLDVKTKFSNRVKFTVDGKLVLITDMGSGDLLVMDAATRKEVKRLHLGKSVEGVFVAPDGVRAFVAESRDNQVAVVDLKKLEVTKTFTTGQEPDGMAWVK
jgi:YVTN family beta-propeller protein